MLLTPLFLQKVVSVVSSWLLITTLRGGGGSSTTAGNALDAIGGWMV
jgi:hypothetical protein